MSGRRDWSEPHRKIVDEGGRCRRCRSAQGPIDAAHVIPRSLAPGLDRNQGYESTIPLCRRCHDRLDGHESGFSILEVLTLDEQIQAVKAAGGIAAAYRITTNRRDL
jgi:hypothetical protein